jgi:hypothetical protein
MPALSSTRDGYLQASIRQTGSFLVLVLRSGFEWGHSGAVLLASGRVTVVTSVTTLWEGVLDLWSDTCVFSRVYGVSPRGCCGFVVTAVTNAVHAGPPILMANFYTLPQDVGASLSVPLGEDQGLLSRPLQLFHDRGYELRGEDAESVGSVCTHNNHENSEGCEVMSNDMHPTRGTRIHPKELQSPLEGRPPHRDTGRIKAPFAGTIYSTPFLKPLLFEHGREALSPECVEDEFSKVGCLEPELIRSERLSETFPGALDELGGAYDLFDLSLGAVSPYVVLSEYLPKGHILLHAGDDVIGDLLLTRGEGGASRASEDPLPEGSLFAHEDS